METDITANMIGKANDTAASALVESRPSQKASISPASIIAESARLMGSTKRIR